MFMIRPIVLSEAAIKHLAEVAPFFEENVATHFKDDGIRLHRKRNGANFNYPLDDVFISISDSKIELRDLNFPWLANFQVNVLKPNLDQSCIDLDLSLGCLKLEGTYEASNPNLRHHLPISQVGKITIQFNNVRATGKVGLVIEEDSQVPQNYDLIYQPTDVAVKVRYHVDKNNEVEREITNPSVDGTLAATVWGQLTEILTTLLHNQLGEVIVEFSFMETFDPHDKEYKEYTKQRSARAHRLLHSLLDTAKDYLVTNNLKKLQTPSFNCIFSERPTGSHQGIFNTNSGYVLDLSTLILFNKSFSIYEDENVLTVYGSISLGQFELGYERYDVQYEEVMIQGNIKAAVSKNKIFVKITIKKEGERCSVHLDDVKVTSIKNIDMSVSGTGSLSWLNEHIKSWVIGNLRHEVLPILENRIKEAFLYSIATTDCIALLVE